MSTQDPRWTPEAVEVVTAAIRKHTDRLLAADGEHGPRLSCTCGGLDYDLMQPDLAPAMAAYRLHRAEAVLGALADAGLLVAAGGETRTEWAAEVDMGNGYRLRPHPAMPYITNHESGLDQYLHAIVKPKRKVTRTVHTGPWVVEVTDTEGTDQ